MIADILCTPMTTGEHILDLIKVVFLFLSVLGVDSDTALTAARAPIEKEKTDE